jgi:hypothetical protein
MLEKRKEKNHPAYVCLLRLNNTVLQAMAFG